MRFSVSNLHADSLVNILNGNGAWPTTEWGCTILERDAEQGGNARLWTSAPRDAVEAAMSVLRETDDRCSAIEFEHQHEIASSSGGPAFLGGATVYRVVQRCACGSRRVLQGPASTSASLKTRVDWHGGDGDIDDCEPAPGWEDRAVERARAAGLFDPPTR